MRVHIAWDPRRTSRPRTHRIQRTSPQYNPSVPLVAQVVPVLPYQGFRAFCHVVVFSSSLVVMQSFQGNCVAALGAWGNQIGEENGVARVPFSGSPPGGFLQSSLPAAGNEGPSSGVPAGVPHARLDGPADLRPEEDRGEDKRSVRGEGLPPFINILSAGEFLHDLQVQLDRKDVSITHYMHITYWCTTERPGVFSPSSTWSIAWTS